MLCRRVRFFRFRLRSYLRSGSFFLLLFRIFKRSVCNEIFHLFMIDRFDFHQGRRHIVQGITMVRKHFDNIIVRLRYHIMHFRINQFGYAFTVIAFMPEALTEKYLVLLFTENHRPELRAHAETGDHLTDDASYALQVAGRSAADFVKNDFFSRPAA